jgi:YVTN family beta-propeller protein
MLVDPQEAPAVRTALPLVSLFLALSTPAAIAQGTFVNWESAHVHPLDLTPDGTKLLAVNTADARLMVYDVTGASLVLLNEIPVGLDPVSVRAHGNLSAWVVNQVSDSVSVVDLSVGNVVGTLRTADEPADVVFAGSPERAFVSCSGANKVLVFDPANLGGAPAEIAILGDQPRALARSLDGTKVYAAIFESGNKTTVLGGGALTNIGFPPNAVNDPAGPYGGVNPPPNSGSSFNPPIASGLPVPPKVGLIVRKNGAGQWLDDNAHDWTNMVSGANAAASGRPVGWDVADDDVAVIDAQSLGVSYAHGLMNLCMGIAVNPGNGQVTVVGTEATNDVRFEPNVSGRFVRVKLARVDSSGATTLGDVDLNPHLNYSGSTIPQSERDKSLGDPRGIVWNSSGARGYVTGMGSNCLVVVDAHGARAGLTDTIPVGEGPTGVVIDEAHSRLFVLDKFEAAISVVSTVTESESVRVPFHDPSPSAIRVGRKHLYDTHKNSGLGQVACGSCHVDGKMDRLAWDLGNPQGLMKSTAGENLGANIPGLNTGFADWHPMKGPMTTQTLQDIIGQEPLHWRGDRAGLEEFNGAFMSLQGDDTDLTPTEMQEFEDFLATITYPPNPSRNVDNTLPTDLPLPGHFTTGRFAPAGQPLPDGNAVNGLAAYRTLSLDAGVLRCVTCHTLPTGSGTDWRLSGFTLQPFPVGPNGEHHRMLVSQDGSTNITIKVPQLRNEYRKVGFNLTQLVNTAGFGVLHDGSVDSLERFVSEPVFQVTSDQMVADLTALLLSFAGSDLPQGSPSNPLEPPGGASKDSSASVGLQTTVLDGTSIPPAQVALLATLQSLAESGKVGLVVKGKQAGIARGYVYIGGGLLQSDRAQERVGIAALEAAAASGNELTWTIVPRGTQTRIGIDRDLDGCLDRDELDGGSDPADPASHVCGPGQPYCSGDGSLATACPCANNGVAGRGCANSQGGSIGGWITSSGAVNPDSVVLYASGMLPTATAVYLQGDTSSTSGIVFGDGVRCVSGALKRLAVKSSVAGASQFPGPGDPTISQRSAQLGDAFGPGSTRYYASYYRDSNLAFCAAPTGNSWNVSNGLRLDW